MDKMTRKDLKHDKFAEEVVDIFGWATHHRDKVLRYGGLGLLVILAAAGFYFYSSSQASARQNALAQAIHSSDATVGPTAQPGTMNFTTQDEKDKAVAKAYGDVAAKYSGSQEGAIAVMQLAGMAADKGNLAEAEKRYKDVVENAPKYYAAMARLALAEVYAVQGKRPDAEKLLREAVANPTTTVSKEQATLALAQLLTKTNPAEAKKLLEPLRLSERTPVSSAAVTAFAALPEDQKKPEPAPPAPASKK